MKVLASLALASTVLLTACASSSQPPADLTRQYHCQSGELITANYPTPNTAQVSYADNHYRMQVALSASGTRYVGDALEWWTKGLGAGSEALLIHHLPDGSSGEVIESCTEI